MRLISRAGEKRQQKGPQCDLDVVNALVVLLMHLCVVLDFVNRNRIVLVHYFRWIAEYPCGYDIFVSLQSRWQWHSQPSVRGESGLDQKVWGVQGGAKIRK